MKNLRGKCVVITGASSGIGRAAAIAFAKQGSNIVLAARRVERLQQIKSEVEAMGVKALVVPTDVTDLNQVQRMIDATIEHFGQVDVMVNNAGQGLLGTFIETPVAETAKIFNLNLVSAAAVMQSALVAMERQGWGVVINISSVAGVLPSPYSSAYSASKAALIMLSESTNTEYAGTRINVVAFCPGFTDTEFAESQKSVGRYKKWIAPIKPASADWVAGRIVKAALKPKPLIILGAYVLPSAIIKMLFPGLFYAAIKRYRDGMQRANPEEQV